jgi:hypothetical protein
MKSFVYRLSPADRWPPPLLRAAAGLDAAWLPAKRASALSE